MNDPADIEAGGGPARMKKHPPEKPKRHLNVNLPEEVEDKIRKVAEATGLPIYGLAEHVAASPKFAEACLAALRERYDAWWNERKAAADIFGGKEDS